MNEDAGYEGLALLISGGVFGAPTVERLEDGGARFTWSAEPPGPPILTAPAPRILTDAEAKAIHEAVMSFFDGPPED